MDKLNADVIIKDEGDYYSVNFQSDNAKKIAKNLFDNRLYEYNDCLRIDVSNSSVDHMKNWVTDNNLTIFNF